MILYILCGIVVLQSVIHHIERKDLYNRIMSKNLTEYKGDKCYSVMSAHDKIIKRWHGKVGEKK